jgi:hypothetical protein
VLHANLIPPYKGDQFSGMIQNSQNRDGLAAVVFLMRHKSRSHTPPD